MMDPKFTLRLMHRQLVVRLVVCSLLFSTQMLIGCTKKRGIPPPEVTHSYPDPVSESVDVDCFFDATLSMKGFVSTDTTSSYQLIVPLLERGVIEAWKGGKISFYRFGDDIAQLPDRQYLNAVKPDFYGDSRYNRRTLIERVLDYADPKHVTIIVTDLFQTNADINQLSERLKQKFLANNLAIGVYAIRSQFKGQIYDVGANAYAFHYESTDPQTGRPFYLIAFGKHADIERYFQMLKNGGVKDLPEKHALIFSHYLTWRSSPFARAKLRTADQISEISASNILSRGYDDERIKAFRIPKGKLNAKFISDLPYDSHMSQVLEYGNALEIEVNAWKAEDKGGKELVLVENQQAKKGFRVSGKLSPDQPPFDKLQIQVDIGVTELPGAGLYGYRVLFRPSQYSLPVWVSEWNMRDEDIAKWNRSRNEFNGAKTYNLQNFLETLQGAVLSTSPPRVGDIYCYIQVNK